MEEKRKGGKIISGALLMSSGAGYTACIFMLGVSPAWAFVDVIFATMALLGGIALSPNVD